jgi:hypothetical protein
MCTVAPMQVVVREAEDLRNRRNANVLSGSGGGGGGRTTSRNVSASQFNYL